MSECRFGCECPFLDFNDPMENAPILVRNPYTNYLIDTRPFFDLLHKHYDDDPRQYAHAIDKEIQLIINLLPKMDNELIPIKNVINEMFDRRDVECRIQLPENTRLKAEKILLKIEGPQ